MIESPLQILRERVAEQLENTMETMRSPRFTLFALMSSIKEYFKRLFHIY